MAILNDLADDIHQIAVDKGFWEENRNFGEQIALMHSELSEALEEHRAGMPIYYESGGKPEGVATELVDCLIRILDTLSSLGVDIDSILDLKVQYNATRLHKHGKAY